MSRQAEVQGARACGLSSPGSSRGSGFSGRGDRGSGTGETAPGWPLASRSLRVLPASSLGRREPPGRGDSPPSRPAAASPWERAHCFLALVLSSRPPR